MPFLRRIASHLGTMTLMYQMYHLFTSHVDYLIRILADFKIKMTVHISRNQLRIKRCISLQIKNNIFFKK